MGIVDDHREGLSAVDTLHPSRHSVRGAQRCAALFYTQALRITDGDRGKSIVDVEQPRHPQTKVARSRGTDDLASRARAIQLQVAGRDLGFLSEPIGYNRRR